MKMAFISDIHGNAIALDAVLNDIKNKGVDKIYVLGDLSYRGPEPKRSLDLIRSLNTEVIKGNADEWVVRGVREGEVPQKALELMNIERQWTVSQLEQTDLDYLAGLPTQIHCEIDGIGIHCFHATPDSLFEVVLPNADDDILEARLMKSSDAQVYVYAHIHKPYIRVIHGKMILNIGSVGLPFDGLAKASYGVIEIEEGNLRTSIQRVSFDQDQVIELYKEVQYPNADMMIGIIRNAEVK
ncbi:MULTISPECIES: metallophosphoesterase family protein [unclassified Paenibacillus]|uniref:metallophosphoesterase family protein n=1 Tax=unclassified Paenibacillus TaxID=185978 RepID=UPI001AEA4E82|nr:MULTISPECIES: metallophosphoesterase family protein [unclassified Paenibacillus]MBP1154373.1 putative phosphoesterase [Paenibacillus sp. PvP091]MBP1170243.1 putative phosphoesterase [Paenibacillus sp. PvR098]MBP2441271.1 putative phosphoesterase [Paenibacillus sp. PvP052]